MTVRIAEEVRVASYLDVEVPGDDRAEYERLRPGSPISGLNARTVEAQYWTVVADAFDYYDWVASAASLEDWVSEREA